jgi:SAM-dependent MidA family methyltransferase
MQMMTTVAALATTFASYMEQALYGPEGYYASGRAQSGRKGDYFTAPDTGPAFGQLLQLIFKQWQAKTGLAPFHVVEAGAGEGALARSLGGEFPYTAIERSPFRQNKLKSAGFAVRPALEDLAQNPVSGCLLGNELLDAFPVHRVRMNRGKLEEGYVTQDSGLSTPHFVWSAPSTPRLAAYFQRLGIELPDGYETEVNLAMSDWFKTAAQALMQGIVLLIDYGRPGHEYYAPERDRGTLRSFRGHRVGEDFFSAPKETDLTADVDFTSAALDARDAGFMPLAFMELGSFLIEGARELTAPVPGLKYLIHPEGMGSAFHVLILGKNISMTPADFPNNRLKRLGF